MEATLDTREWDEWFNNQPNRDRAKGLFLRVTKNEALNRIKEKEQGHNRTNELTNATIGEVVGDTITIYGPLYGDIVLEYGRMPGKFPPVEPLSRWAGQVLGNEELGYVIARNIARSGTQKYRSKGPKELTEVMDRLNDVFLPKELSKLLDEYMK